MGRKIAQANWLPGVQRFKRASAKDDVRLELIVPAPLMAGDRSEFIVIFLFESRVLRNEWGGMEQRIGKLFKRVLSTNPLTPVGPVNSKTAPSRREAAIRTARSRR